MNYDNDMRSILKGKTTDALGSIFSRLGEATPEFSLLYSVSPADKVRWSLILEPEDYKTPEAGYFVYAQVPFAFAHIPSLNATAWLASLVLSFYAKTSEVATAMTQLLSLELAATTLGELARGKRSRVAFLEQQAMEHFQYQLKYGGK